MRCRTGLGEVSQMTHTWWSRLEDCYILVMERIYCSLLFRMIYSHWPFHLYVFSFHVSISSTVMSNFAAIPIHRRSVSRKPGRERTLEIPTGTIISWDSGVHGTCTIWVRRGRIRWKRTWRYAHFLAYENVSSPMWCSKPIWDWPGWIREQFKPVLYDANWAAVIPAAV